MPLINTKTLLNKANKGKYAVGAFNFSNLESLQAIMETAAKLKSPVILGVSTSAIDYMGGQLMVEMVKGASKHYGVPAALHLDHGKTFEDCKNAIDLGFKSVMIDGSHLEYEENVKLTKKVVEYAKARNVTVEGELGQLKGIEDKVVSKTASYTNPQLAYEFVKETGVNSLAISIGTSHGAYKFKGKPNLKLKLLKEIKDLLPNTPLVLHGASSISTSLLIKFFKSGGRIKRAIGVTEELLKKAIDLGINKVNVDSDLRIAFTAGTRRILKNKKEFNPRTYLRAGRSEIVNQVEYKISNIFGSKNKI